MLYKCKIYRFKTIKGQKLKPGTPDRFKLSANPQMIHSNFAAFQPLLAASFDLTAHLSVQYHQHRHQQQQQPGMDHWIIGLILNRLYITVRDFAVKIHRGGNVSLKDGRHYSVCVYKQLWSTHLLWVTHRQHPGHSSPWKRGMLCLISIQTVTENQPHLWMEPKHTAANWCRDKIVVNLPDNPRREADGLRCSATTMQQVVLVGFQSGRVAALKMLNCGLRGGCRGKISADGCRPFWDKRLLTPIYQGAERAQTKTAVSDSLCSQIHTFVLSVFKSTHESSVSDCTQSLEMIKLHSNLIWICEQTWRDWIREMWHSLRDSGGKWWVLKQEVSLHFSTSCSLISKCFF